MEACRVLIRQACVDKKKKRVSGFYFPKWLENENGRSTHTVFQLFRPPREQIGRLITERGRTGEARVIYGNPTH